MKLTAELKGSVQNSNVKKSLTIALAMILGILSLGINLDLSAVEEIVTVILNTFFPIMVILFIVELVSQAFGFSLIKRLLDIF